MLALALAAVLASTPAPVEGWARKACPPPRQEPDSNIELKFQRQQRAECLRKAMNKALDRVILPLKKQKSPAFKEWMALQADYNRWMADACAALEEAQWVDLASGERSMGTGYGLSERACLQGQYAWRGFFADAWARGDWKSLQRVLEEWKAPADKECQALQAYRARVQAAAARAPVHVEESDVPVRQLTREDWKHYNERLERVASAPEALARRQCALLPKPLPECQERFADSLHAQLGFSEVSGDPATVP